MSHKPLSEATIKNLEEITRSNLTDYVNMVDMVKSAIRTIDNVIKFSVEKGYNNHNNDYHHLRRLNECSLLLGLIWLDITSAYRIYLNAKEKYEIAYATKQLIVTINEGFKQIYNYVWYDEKGNLKTRERNQSFWVKDIGSIIKDKLAHLIGEYDQITAKLDTYDDQDLKNLKDPRNLFVHYDKEPSLVYDELINQDIEKTTSKTLPFMVILSEMVSFNKRVLIEYNTMIEEKGKDFKKEQNLKIEALKQKHRDNPQAVSLLNDMQNFLQNFPKK